MEGYRAQFAIFTRIFWTTEHVNVDFKDWHSLVPDTIDRISAIC